MSPLLPMARIVTTLLFPSILYTTRICPILYLYKSFNFPCNQLMLGELNAFFFYVPFLSDLTISKPPIPLYVKRPLAIRASFSRKLNARQ